MAKIRQAFPQPPARGKIEPTFSQTKVRGSNDDEYQIYVAAAESLGWTVKTYDEWLNS